MGGWVGRRVGRGREEKDTVKRSLETQLRNNQSSNIFYLSNQNVVSCCRFLLVVVLLLLKLVLVHIVIVTLEDEADAVVTGADHAPTVR